MDVSSCQEYIEFILEPMRNELATEALRRKVLDLLNRQQFEQGLEASYQVFLRKGKAGQDRDYIEVVLESKA